MVTAKDILKDNSLTEFQVNKIKKLFEEGLTIIDWSVEWRGDLTLIITDNEYITESLLICPQEDMFFSAIGKKDSVLDTFFKTE